jgi:probable rRNA maturation factor
VTPGASVTIAVQIAVDTAEVPRSRLPAAAVIKRWVRGVLVRENRGGELTVRIVGAGEGAELNRRYRRKRGPTNVLSFPYGQPHETMPPLLGDIVICAPVVTAEAREQGKAAEAHWAHMVVHGVLHLLGYDHEIESQARTMEALETELLRGLGYTDPYAGEARGGPGQKDVISQGT